MSRRLTIYVPDDVAERVDQVENASAFFTDAARRVMRNDTFLETHRRMGRPEIPQEMIDKANAALQEEMRLRQDPQWVAEQTAYYEPLLARLRKIAQ